MAQLCALIAVKLLVFIFHVLVFGVRRVDKHYPP